MNFNSTGTAVRKKQRCVVTKTLLVMKLTALLILIAAMQVTAAGFAQNITLSENNAPLEKVFNEIKKQSGYVFFYEKKTLDNTANVTIHVKDADINSALQLCLKGQPLSYTISGNFIGIKRVSSLLTNEMPIPVVPIVSESDPIKITGQVVDSAGNPIADASVIIKGTKIGTTTSKDGHFLIESSKTSGILVVSYIGFTNKEVAFSDGNTNLKIKIVAQVNVQQDVVVVGYGTQRKINMTGAIETVNVSDFESRPLTNTSAALQGKVTGAYITQTSGRPGFDNATILIRGVGTFNNTAPLVIIDGFEGSLNDVAPGDIESITVLKDAASSSIYGNKASNGVILITTKKGKGNKLSVEYSGLYSIQKVTTSPKVLDGLDYINLKNQAYIYSTGTGYNGYNEDLQHFQNNTDPVTYPPHFSWFNFLTQAAPLTNHSVRLTGGNDMFKVAASAFYNDQQGILKGTDASKIGYRLNLSSNLYHNRLKTEIGISGMTQKIKEFQQAEWGMYFTYMNSPLVPASIPAGVAGSSDPGGFTGAAWQLAMDQYGGGHFATNVPLNIQAKASYNLLDNLTASIAYDYNKQTNSVEDWLPLAYVYNYYPGGWRKELSGYSGSNGLYLTSNNYLAKDFQSQLDYNKKFFRGRLDLKALGGFQSRLYQFDQTTASRTNYTTNLPILSAGDPSTQKNGAYAEEGTWLSYFGRVNLAYNNKYLLEANIRRDGSSRFLNKWGTFPSVSAGWKISEESFLRGSKFISNLKLRASWGILGNESIGSYYASTDQLGLDKTYNFANTLQTAAYVSVMANKQTTWERSRQWDIGLDFGLFNNALSGTVDYFNKYNSDILMQLPVSATLGITNTPYQNVGEMTNSGIELQLNYGHKFGRLNSRISAGFTKVENKVTGLGGLDQVVFSDWTQSVIWKIGQPYNSYYGLKVDGIYQSQSEIDKHLSKGGQGTYFGYNAKPGNIRFKDLNSDGKIDGDDRTVIGKPYPNFTYSTAFNFDYGNFDLGILFLGVSGVNTVNQFAPVTPFTNGVGNVLDIYKNGWTESNHSQTIQAVNIDDGKNSIPSEYYMENASYLRLKNIEAGYTIHTSASSKIGLSSFRVYAGIQNALTFTKMRYGFDPEKPVAAGQMKSLTGVAGAPNNWIGYPQSRIFTVGVSAKF
ncbi:TonB-dependent receptor [Chitinophagaceae bacterium 26-R-25]|nr:TonB-dependent receptor [Chitinophagaceae bacterium 26-R-25]